MCKCYTCEDHFTCRGCTLNCKICPRRIHVPVCRIAESTLSDTQEVLAIGCDSGVAD
jgi:hypothetical protein